MSPTVASTAVDGLTALAAEDLARWNVPGLELVVVSDDTVRLAEGVGRRVDDLPVTPRTLFHHGSTGKAFTGVLVGTLVDDGLLDWDTPVRTYLPNFRLPDPLVSDRVTTADLLSHRGGLVRHDFVWLVNPSLSRAELVARMRNLESPLDFRTTFSYSNLAYVTAGHLVGEVTGSTWEEEMRRRVLEPLGMYRTINSVSMAQADDDHAQPYVERNGVLEPIPWRQSDQIAPAGQMISCAADMARWLRFQLGDGTLDGRRVISSENLARTRRLSTPIDKIGPDPDIRFYGYAFGWLVGTYRGRRLAWHNGGIDGFKTDIALLPDDGLAVAVSCNVLQTEMPFALVFSALDRLLGFEPKPWSENLRRQSAPDPAAEEEQVVPDTQPAHPIDAYAGIYRHPGYGSLQVTVNGALSVRLGEIDVAAVHRHFDTWTLRYEALDISWPLTFITDAEGQVTAAEIPLEPMTDPIRFERVPEGARS